MSKFLVKWKNKPEENGIKINCSNAEEAKRIFLKGKKGNEEELEAILIKDESNLTAQFPVLLGVLLVHYEINFCV
jgi:hypothetical protein